MLTEKERETALGLLARSRTTVLNAIDGVTEDQARWKPAPERWSILEYVEHLAIAEDALIALIEKSLESPPHVETPEERREREQKIRATPMPRGVNKAPHTMQPTARFASLEEAVAAFLAARERSVDYARTTTNDLRSHFANHIVLGPMDGYQWLCGNARHAETHAAHMAEIRSLPGFPQ